MKTWTIIGGVVLVLALLVFRLIYVKNNLAKEERKWYVSQLGFNFYGRITEVHSGQILFTITGGAFDPRKESRLAKKIRHHGGVGLLYRTKEKFMIFYPTATGIERGDSICIDSDKNSIRIFHGDSLLRETEVLRSLQGGPLGN